MYDPKEKEQSEENKYEEYEDNSFYIEHETEKEHYRRDRHFK